MGPSWLVGTTANESGRYPSFSSPSEHRSRIAVRSQGTSFLLDDDEVLAVKTQRNRVILQRQTDSKDVTGSRAEPVLRGGFHFILPATTADNSERDMESR